MAITDAKGILFYKSEVETGTTKNGNPFSKMTIVIKLDNTKEPYDKIALSVFGDRCLDADRIKVGDKVEIAYSISAREWQGKWFNDCSLFKITRNEMINAPAPAADPFEGIDPKGDLPF